MSFPSTTDVLPDGTGPENFEGYDDYITLLPLYPENEMIKGDNNVNVQLKAKMQFLNKVGSKDFNEAISSESSSNALIRRGKKPERL